MMKPINSDDVAISFDAAAFNRAVIKTMIDTLSGRITPAEARKINAEHDRILKTVEQVLKFGRMSKRRGAA